MKAANDKGVTLVELIIVITILGILTGIAIWSHRTVYSTDVSSAAKSMDSYLEEIRTKNMSMADTCYLAVYQSGDADHRGIYVAGTTNPNEFVKNPQTDKRVGGKQIELSILTMDGTEVIQNNEVLFVTFDRVNGALSKCLRKVEGGTAEDTTVPDSIILSGGGKEKNIVFVKETGKHYVR